MCSLDAKTTAAIALIMFQEKNDERPQAAVIREGLAALEREGMLAALPTGKSAVLSSAAASALIETLVGIVCEQREQNVEQYVLKVKPAPKLISEEDAASHEYSCTRQSMAKRSAVEGSSTGIVSAPLKKPKNEPTVKNQSLKGHGGSKEEEEEDVSGVEEEGVEYDSGSKEKEEDDDSGSEEEEEEYDGDDSWSCHHPGPEQAESEKKIDPTEGAPCLVDYGPKGKPDW